MIINGKHCYIIIKELTNPQTMINDVINMRDKLQTDEKTHKLGVTPDGMIKITSLIGKDNPLVTQEQFIQIHNSAMIQFLSDYLAKLASEKK